MTDVSALRRACSLLPTRNSAAFLGDIISLLSSLHPAPDAAPISAAEPGPEDAPAAEKSGNGTTDSPNTASAPPVAKTTATADRATGDADNDMDGDADDGDANEMLDPLFASLDTAVKDEQISLTEKAQRSRPLQPSDTRILLFAVGDEDVEYTSDGDEVAGNPPDPYARVSTIASWLSDRARAELARDPAHAGIAEPDILAVTSPNVPPIFWTKQMLRPRCVVVARASDFRAAFLAGYLSMQSVHTLVYERAECVADADDDVALLLRDSWAAVSGRKRLAVLGLSRQPLTPGGIRGLAAEHLLRAHWFHCGEGSRDSQNPAVSFGRKARPIKVDVPLVEVEEVLFVEESGRDAPSIKGTQFDRLDLSDQAVILREIGPYGVALYEHKVEMRKLRWKWRKLLRERTGVDPEWSEYSADDAHFSFDPYNPVGGADCLLGVKPKALRMLDIIQKELIASHALDEIRRENWDHSQPFDPSLLLPVQPIIVHAGRPVVAAALHELVRNLPGFAKFTSRVVLGDSNSATTLGPHSEQALGWQGEESDDDAIGAFNAGDLHILFVASDNAAKIAFERRPLPPAPLVIRYDGSDYISSVDGGGGRCRVIVFKAERSEPGFSALLNAKFDSLAQERSKAKADGGDDSEGDDDDVSDGSHTSWRSVMSGEKKIGSSPVGSAGVSDEERDTSKIGEGNLATYEEVDGASNAMPVSLCPVGALRGPKEADGQECFLYTVRPVLSSSASPGACLKREGEDLTGVSDFVLVFSARLESNDLVVDSTLGSEEIAMRTYGNLHLESLGTVVLSAQQVAQGRSYTAAVFGKVMKNHDTNLFQWGRGADEKGETTRRYLVMPRWIPSRRKLVASSFRARPQLSSVADCMKYYFGDDASELLSAAKLSIIDGANEGNQDGAVDKSNLDVDASGKSAIDWSAVEELVTFVKEGSQNARTAQPLVPTSNANWDALSLLETRLVYAVYDGRNKSYLSAGLDWSVCPLSKFIRQKRFDLNAEGHIVDWKEAVRKMVPEKVNLASLVPASVAKDSVDEEVVSLLGKRPRPSEEDNDDCGAPGFSGGKVAVPGLGTNANLSMAQNFNAERNKKKKRTAWFGPVRETYEEYLTSSRSSGCTDLHQPLLSLVTPDAFSLDDFWRVATGIPLSTVIKEYMAVQAAAKDDSTGKGVPEVFRCQPLGTGALFLSSVLLLVERHVTSCALRAQLAPKVSHCVEIPMLTRAMTSISVNRTHNYERLELLGDSVLKLGCTLRLFTQYPHYAEGDLHPLRCIIISNATLNKKAKESGMQHFLNFTRAWHWDWPPPGFETNAQVLPLPDKALADVMEGTTGVYYLQGVKDFESGLRQSKASGTEGEGEDKKKRRSRGSRFSSQPRSDSELVGLLKVEDVEADLATSTSPSDFSMDAVVCGYRAGTEFLQAFGVLDGDEPSEKQVLIAAIHAMHEAGAPVPKDVNPSSFPADARMTNPTKPWADHLGRVEDIIGYKFKRRQLLLSAFTHGTFADAPTAGGGTLLSKGESFQRLEFLGDAVVDFCVSRYLFDRYPSLGPGELTELKSAVVSNEAFARITVTLKLHRYLFSRSRSLGRDVDAFDRAVRSEMRDSAERKEWWSFERECPKVLADLFESIVGAVLVDAGLATCWKVCLNLLGDTLRLRADPKTFASHPVKQFQDFVTKDERMSIKSPLYVIPDKAGGKRRNNMRATVYIHRKAIATGYGSTRKRAMCSAAQIGLARLRAAAIAAPSDKDAKLLRQLRETGDREKADAERKRVGSRY